MSSRNASVRGWIRGSKSRKPATDISPAEALGVDRGELGAHRPRGSRTGEKYGWGRNGAVRLQDPPPRDQGLDCAPAMGRSRMGSLRDMGGSDGPGIEGRGFGGPGFRGGGGGGVRPDMMGMGARHPSMGSNSFASPRSPFAYSGQPFGSEGMQAQYPRSPRAGMAGGMRGPDAFMGEDRLPMGGMGSPRGSMRSHPSFDLHAMDRQRMPYGPNSFRNPYQNYCPPYVEDYEGSEMGPEMAQAAMARGIGQGPFGGIPFGFEEGLGDNFGGLGQVDHMAGVNLRAGLHSMVGMNPGIMGPFGGTDFEGGLGGGLGGRPQY